MNRPCDNSDHCLRHLLVPVLLPLVLSACASSGSRSDGDDYVTGPTEHLLMAEIALSRGEYLVAAQQYVRTADQSNDPELAQRATEYAFDYGFDAYALRSAERWAELDPNDLLPHIYLGRLYFRSYDLERSYEHYELALGPVDERVDQDYLVLAADLAVEQQPQHTLWLMTRIREANPGAPGAWLAEAGAALQAGDAAIALESAMKTYELAPDWARADAMVARALLLSGDSDAALERLDALLERSPSLAMELEYARLLADAGENLAALERLDELARQYQGQPEIVRMHGIISLQTDDYDAAWASFSQLLSTGHNVNESFYYLGRIAFQRQRYLQAVRLHRRIRSGPYLVSAQLSISRAYALLGDPETGLNHLRQFAELYPKHGYDVFQAEARLLMQMERQEEVLEIYQTALVYKPDSEEILLARGSVLESMDRLDEAIADFRRALAVAPDSSIALNALGYTLANRTRRYREASRYIERAFELDPENPAIIDSMGWVLYRRGKLGDALVYLERAHSMMPDPEISAHLGEVLSAQGDNEAAMNIWTEALEEYPDSRVLNDTVSRFNK